MYPGPFGAPPNMAATRVAAKEAGGKLRLQPEDRGDDASDSTQPWWLQRRLQFQPTAAVVWSRFQCQVRVTAW